MLTVKYLLEVVGFVLIAAAAAILLHDLYRLYQQSNLILNDQARPAVIQPRYRAAGRIAALALVCLMAGLSMQVVPAGMAGVRVSQISGTLPGTLYPGFHLVIPLVQTIDLYGIRDQIYQTTIGGKSGRQLNTKEGLTVGLVVAVRYRIDPKRLPYVNANLPQLVDLALVPPVVGSAFRGIAPNYLVRDLFAPRREEIRREAANAITSELAPDAILVKEVMLRDIELPAEYAKGIEGALLKEQKEVRTAELEAEADVSRLRRTATSSW